MVDKVNKILLEDSENVERRMKCRLALNNFDCYKELLSERKHKTKQSNLKDYFKSEYRYSHVHLLLVYLSINHLFAKKWTF